ncbi:ATP-dependent DNA helicase PcrA [bacterium BMS3Abin07]|nr:ATP-dependent DNA helicase PcrA [bacterium BMS3Abin07]GBE33419.1 ATP-dependent DNA helicase PcrA [bacterium BMS3Bbin05]HDL21059.1 ATP-dependent DNA helicase PcrA [Nitrospirota bacterium]HDO21245.1 ATP-dependent DNA helicase PcrA [Nitrospirota bacterium]
MATRIILSNLNTQQKKAVKSIDSPLLILAGAGSGKTRVITHKYAYLLSSSKLKPSDILTVTFTNKAAGEMKERICRMVHCDMDKNWIGTFHSQCNKILKREIHRLGYKNDFIIYDNHDACNLIKHILKELKIYEALYKGVASRISALKSSLLTADEFVASDDSFGFDEKLARVYMMYQYEMKRCNAIDFDDLIMLTVRLFNEYPEVLSKYQRTFKYVLVDEFQDTNPAQYALLKCLVSRMKKFCAVGDDDQSIYRFRGADVGNMASLEKDFPGLNVIKLEQNYRNTQHILNVSNSIISKNPVRKEKKLWTARTDGDKVSHYWFGTELEEAKYIAKIIKEMYLKGKHTYKDMAIFYRVNMQSRAIEDALKSERIPYRIVGGMSFYQKKEIKDVLAYLRLCINPHDNVSLRRVINYPSRGIGIATLNKIETEAKKCNKSLYDTIREICSTKSVSASVLDKLNGFTNKIGNIDVNEFPYAADLLKIIIEKAGLLNKLEDERVQDIYELVSSADNVPVAEFLDRISLITNLDDQNQLNAVSLMTLHAAKGLEFPIVFILGIEEGILPYFKAEDNPEEMYEERRLLYVGITRAKDMLYLTGSARRRLYSRIQSQVPSRFISEIPSEYCRMISKCKSNGMQRKVIPALRKVAIPASYKTGCRVRHPKWGVGVIRDCYGEGDDQKVMVNFPEIGIKRLALKFAHLERI